MAPGQNVRAGGEDFPEGATLVLPGGTFPPDAIAACSATGNARVWVKRKLRLLFIPTGSELLPPDAPLQPGKVH